MTASLSRLMGNTGGAGKDKKRLFIATVHLTLRSGAVIWDEAFRVKKYCKIIMEVQRRRALRIISAYRTVSEQNNVLATPSEIKEWEGYTPSGMTKAIARL